MGDPDFSKVLLEEERLRTDIEQARQELADSLVSIRDRVADKLDWKGLVRRQPVPVVVGGVVLGFVVARLFARRKDER